MTRFHKLNARYAAAQSIASGGVEILAVGDSVGAHLDAAIKELLGFARDDGADYWEDIVGAARRLRWHRVMEPQPIQQNLTLQELAVSVASQATNLRRGVGDEAGAVLERLADAAGAVQHDDPAVGPVLIRCIKEIDAKSCFVLAASARAASGIRDWFAGIKLDVPVVSSVERRGPLEILEQAYAVGPPRFFSPSVVTAPTASALTYLLPSWEANRSIPRSVFASQAEGAIVPRPRVFQEGDEPVLRRPVVEVADDVIPHPVWPARQRPDRDPRPDEVLAHRVLLSGGLAVYLDRDGEHIRTLDPTQPDGERVMQSDVSLVGPGTYLVLREGQTERQALYDRAVALLGNRGASAEAAQRKWKGALQAKVTLLGRRAVVRALEKAGVHAASQAAAWIEPTVARPQSSQDFERLLAWLGIPLHPTFQLATDLRRLRFRASADIRESLERALSAADMDELERDGHLRIDLDLDMPGFRGIIATRVLAISPQPQAVARHEARVIEKDRRSQWLE